MKATTRNALLAGNAFDRMRSAHVSDGACHRPGVAGLLPPDDYWTYVPSSCDRSFGLDALRTGPDLRSALDDLVLKAHFVAPVVAEHVLVRERPAIDDIAGFFLEATGALRLPLVADDCMVISGESSVDQLVTVSAVPTGDRMLYQLSLASFAISAPVLVTVRLFRGLSLAFGVCAFPDADLIGTLGLNPAGKGLRSYIESPTRQRPCFVMKRPTTPTNRERAYVRLTAMILNALGPTAVNDRLFAELADGWEDRNDVLAFAPGSTTPTVLGYVSDYDLPDDLDAFLESCPLLEAMTGVGDVIDGMSQHGCPASANWALGQTGRITLSKVAQSGARFRGAMSQIEAPAPPAPEAIETAPSLVLPPPDTDRFLAEAERTRLPEPLSLDDEGFPRTAQDVSRWVDERFQDAIVILPRARRMLAKSDHPDPRRLAQAIALLAGAKLRAYRGDRAAVAQFDAELLSLRLRDGFSNAELLRGHTGGAYVIEHQGRQMLLDRHLASTTSGFNDPRLIRIYYVYDKICSMIVIGSLPGHLPTSRS